ncbi:hypothetical protein [Deinococcus knuensis]|uniref:Uncharacterized protein n=1 Tax=Deinococcus knuensis TaxID=1837380 RepID=A0ABQ2SHD0_9DEIO|nr:hypothetical protein [Deinococcus knuensis]GGS28439.1 hypothetical protein GCM10008961_20080 [Deinococcus knuensis]
MAGSLLIGRIPVRYDDLSLLQRLIEQHPGITFKALKETLTPHWTYYLSSSASLLKETLSFGTTLGLFISSAERSWDDRTFSTSYQSKHLRATILHLLSAQSDTSQRAFRGVHDELIDQGHVHTDISSILECMETGPYGQIFRWNDTKVNFWSQFMHDLGLVIRLPPERVILSPTTSLLRELLPAQCGPVRPLLETWHRDYHAVFTRLGEVHEGLARALLRLEQQGHMTFTYASDAVGSVLLCGRRISHWTHPAAGDTHVDSL